MKSFLVLLILRIISLISLTANQWESDYPLISGHYEVIGKTYESEKLFLGSIIIEEVKPNQFVVTRLIDRKKVIGSGRVEFVTADEIPVFRMRFTENGSEMVGTFLWQADLDNDGRITGYVSKKGYRGEKPGLEALFAVKG